MLTINVNRWYSDKRGFVHTRPSRPESTDDIRREVINPELLDYPGVNRISIKNGRIVEASGYNSEEGLFNFFC